jgi:hypothetical protein
MLPDILRQGVVVLSMQLLRGSRGLLATLSICRFNTSLGFVDG